MVLRGLRRRFSGARGELLGQLVVRVLAVSPFPDEPAGDETYTPTLIVETNSDPGDPALSPARLAITTLLFVEWAQARLNDTSVPQQLQALLPRLRLAVTQGRLGPAAYQRHRAAQHERYFNHREAATFTVALRQDEHSLFVEIERHLAKGRWTETTAMRRAATVAPYEALLRLDAPNALLLLAWLERASDRWLAGRPADFPVGAWTSASTLAAPE
ncbi:MAG: hypothetical protein ACTHNK_02545 [Thermomicrobiales bacterium]